MSCDVDILHTQIFVHEYGANGPMGAIGCVADAEISQL